MRYFLIVVLMYDFLLLFCAGTFYRVQRFPYFNSFICGPFLLALLAFYFFVVW